MSAKNAKRMRTKTSGPHSCRAAALARSALALHTPRVSPCRLALPARAGSADSWDGPKTVPTTNPSQTVKNRNSRGWKGSPRLKSHRIARGRHPRRRLPSRCDNILQRRWRRCAAHTQLHFGFIFPSILSFHASRSRSTNLLAHPRFPSSA